MEPFFKMKVGNGDEFDITDKIPDLKYLGVDDASSSPQFTRPVWQRWVFFCKSNISQANL